MRDTVALAILEFSCVLYIEHGDPMSMPRRPSRNAKGELLYILISRPRYGRLFSPTLRVLATGPLRSQVEGGGYHLGSDTVTVVGVGWLDV